MFLRWIAAQRASRTCSSLANYSDIPAGIACRIGPGVTTWLDVCTVPEMLPPVERFLPERLEDLVDFAAAAAASVDGPGTAAARLTVPELTPAEALGAAAAGAMPLLWLGCRNLHFSSNRQKPFDFQWRQTITLFSMFAASTEDTSSTAVARTRCCAVLLPSDGGLCCGSCG